MFRRIANSDFIIRLTHWEYWPFGILQLPVFFYFFWLALRSRSLLFFTASNPGITMGGMFGESKYEILQKLPAAIRPKTIRIAPGLTTNLEQQLKLHGLQYPLIFKPDIGERGFRVSRINNASEAKAYFEGAPGDFLIQELVSLPLEFGVLYSRKPSQATGTVASIVAKEMLFVEGDGISTLASLIRQKPRAKLQWRSLEKRYSSRLHEVLPKGVRMELVSIGNHCLGTKFLNGNHLISEELTASFDRISHQIEGFFFGRFDLRCASIEDLTQGKVMVMELNGCGAEPAHIYDPDFKLLPAIAALCRHWRMIFEISRENKRLGVPFLSLTEGLSYYRSFKALTR